MTIMTAVPPFGAYFTPIISLIHDIHVDFVVGKCHPHFTISIIMTTIFTIPLIFTISIIMTSNYYFQPHSTFHFPPSNHVYIG